MNTIWEINSNPLKQMLHILASIAIGLLFCIGFRDYDPSGFISNSFAGYLLGWLLLWIGLWGFIINNQRTVRVDSQKAMLFIIDKTRFKQSQQSIAFQQISQVNLEELGDKSDGAVSYDVVLTLKNGKNVSLFRAAIFDGTYDKQSMEMRRRQLQNLLHL